MESAHLIGGPPSSSTNAQVEPAGTAEREMPERDAVAPGISLPCLLSNNCTSEEKKSINQLAGAHKRMAFVVAFEIMELAREFGLERLGFFTLTFKDNVTDLREAQKRFRSLRTHVIAKRYERAIGVRERHQSGRIHFHLVVVTKADIRSGANFEAFKRKDYRSANSALRSEWAFWRDTCPKYRFGRHELMPVKSNHEGIARYVGKYISKHVTQRLPEDKGARVVRFIGYKQGMRKASLKFSWATENGWLWRHKTAAFARRFGISNIGQMQTHFGPRWAYHLQDSILGERLNGIMYPSYSACCKGQLQSDKMLIGRLNAQRIIEQRPASQTRIMMDKVLDESPIWGVPRWRGEKVSCNTASPEAVAEGEERAREMRLYALRIPAKNDCSTKEIMSP